MIRLGSLFAGTGGFELGAQWAFDRAGIPHKVLFQVEQNKYCQSILKKHWPDAQVFDDVCAVGRHNLPDVDILMGGFPCQDISVAGHQKGVINGKKSGLWFEMLRIISELRPKIAVLENVPNVLRVGGPAVIGGLTKIGYDCEWTIVSAKQFGAPHLRKRWFCIATNTNHRSASTKIQTGWQKHSVCNTGAEKNATNPDIEYMQEQPINAKPMEEARLSECGSGKIEWQNKDQYWKKGPTEPPLCSMDDGIPDRLARLRALGNAIVPQCSEYIFEHIIKNIIQNS